MKTYWKTTSVLFVLALVASGVGEYFNTKREYDKDGKKN
jgi:hypothetical protein